MRAEDALLVIEGLGLTLGVADEEIETEALPEPDEISDDVLLADGQWLTVGDTEPLRLADGQLLVVCETEPLRLADRQ